MVIFLIIVVITIAIFFFMRAIFNFKHGIELTIKPFNEWMMIARSESNKQLEVMSHTLLLETSGLLERINIINKKDFTKLFANSKVYASDFIMIILATVEMQEKLSLIDPNQFQLRDSLPAKIYLSNCICRLYFDGFYYDNNFYKGENSLLAIANYISDKEQESWK
jgi:hypothetical protein